MTRAGTEQVQTRWGPMHVFVNDTGVSDTLREFGEYAPAEIDIYNGLLEPGDTFVDVGANIGVVSRAVGSGPARPRVLGFEPMAELFRMAVVNTFELGNVDVYPFAVSDRPHLAIVGELDRARRGNYGSLALEGPERAVSLPCPVVRLDEFLAPRAPRPRLVKIDVEGMEAAVVRGLEGVSHERLAISAEADRRDRVPELLAALDGLGCSKFAVFARAVSASNPRFDPHKRKCRVRHVQVLGFVGPAPRWLLETPGVWPIPTIADFDRLAAKYFAPGGGPG